MSMVTGYGRQSHCNGLIKRIASEAGELVPSDMWMRKIRLAVGNWPHPFPWAICRRKQSRLVLGLLVHYRHRRTGQFFSRWAETSLPEKYFDSARKKLLI